MDSFVRRFIRASLVWLAVGVLIGISMAFWPASLIYRPAHMHANLLGFVSMMIFGVAYHVIPRFSGKALHSRKLADLHFMVANAGLAFMVAGWIAVVTSPYWGMIAVRIGGAGSAVGAFLYIYNIWRTLEPAARPDRTVSGSPETSGRQTATTIALRSRLTQQ